ncbi:MAG: hypothetical protein K5853_02325 [Lachnospiraceae bacterium]|nr:hypothetical protein [Lachnospiraceae bacterium]
MRSLINSLKEKEFTIADLCLLIILAAQFCFLAYVNLFCNEALNDFDAAGAYVHILDVYKSRSLFPATYGYATTMDVDSTVWLGALIFAICKNVFVAQGICNILVILAYLFVIREIFQAIHGNREAMLISMILILVPYSMGMVGYWNLMFVGVACNTVRNLIPLLYFSVILDLYDADRRNIKCLLKFIACLILMLVTSISAGFYVMLFGILSLILCDVFIFLKNGNLKALMDLRWVCHLLMIVFCKLGLTIQSHMGFTARSTEQALIPSLFFTKNISDWFTGIFMMFGALPENEHIGLFDQIGKVNAIKYGITLLVLGVFLYYLLRFMLEKTMPNHVLYVLFIGLIDGLALILLDTGYGTLIYEYRYHIMPMLFLILAVGFFLDEKFHLGNPLIKFGISALAVVGLAATLYLSDQVALLSIDFNDNPTGEVSSVEMLKSIDGLMEENDVDTAVIYTAVMGAEGRKLRAYGDTTDYVLYIPSEGEPSYGWGGSSRVHEKKGATGKTALITTAEELAMAPEAAVNNAKKIADIGILEIYLIPEGAIEL